MHLALIVDDSKTARVALRKMLEKLNIPVATVESGEEALEYLQSSHPDVIFMDHMMPGMDGFAAVKAIKSDPAIASIPIVMHTTKKGDIYVGQARALGAADILPKPASDQDLDDVLARVRKQTAAKIAARTTMEMSVVVVDDGNNDDDTNDDSAGELSFSADPGPKGRPRYERVSFLGSFRQWLIAVIWLVPTLWLLNLYWQSSREISSLQSSRVELYKSLEWAVNQHASYDYGELPMANDRLKLLLSLMGRLERAGFQGVIRMEGHVGEFCLSLLPLQDGSEMLMLPGPEMPITSCDVIGTSASAAMRASIQQNSAFSRYLQDLQLQDNGIRVELMPYGSGDPAYSYPIDLEGVTTGDWNTIALANNRVKFSFIPFL